MSLSHLPVTEIPDPFNQTQVHLISAADLRALIEDDPEGHIKPTIFVNTGSGSRYQLDIIGPTMQAVYFGGTVKVRQAAWWRTRTFGMQHGKTEYIGLSAGVILRLRFFSTLHGVTDPGEHRVMQIPSSDILDPQMQLVIDWNKL
jgi:hypothetical protein